MDVLVQEMGDELLVVLPKDFPMARSAKLDKIFIPLLDRKMPITLDISNIAYIDSTGLGTLLWLNRKTPGRLKLINLSPAVKRVIGLCEVAQFFEFDEPPGKIHG